MRGSKTLDAIILVVMMLLLIAVDLASKQIAANFLHGTHTFFEGERWKTGLQFVINNSGFLVSPIHLLLYNFAAVLVMCWLRPKLGADWLSIAMSTMMAYAGVWGNCLDFFIRGGVADFLMIHFEYGTTATRSIFNFADMYIVLGASMVFALNIVRWTRLFKTRYNLGR